MEKEKTKRKFIHKLRSRYRLVILNEDTLEDVWYAVLSRMNMILWLGFISVILVAVGIILVSFTPLREYIPGYPNGDIKWLYMQNALKTDSLEQQIQVRDNYIENIRQILKGKDTNKHFDNIDTTEAVLNIVIEEHQFDPELQQQVDDAEKYDVQNYEFVQIEEKFDLNKLHFYCPLKGKVTNNFDTKTDHFAIDVVSNLNEPILSVLDGTVILTGWTLEAGYIILIQHRNELISVYKHNSQLLKQMGDRVLAGEAVAIVGNTGEYTTGSHLHFELWHKGKPLNPIDYIVF